MDTRLDPVIIYCGAEIIMRKMHAAVLAEYGRFEWKEIDYPRLMENEALVRVEYASICGSDQHIFLGEFHPRTPVPFVPGHEFAGKVIKAGSQVSNIQEGDLVAIDPIVWCGKCPACQRQHYPACTALRLVGVDMNGGFGQYISLPEHMLYKVRPDVPAMHAALVELYGIGYHSCKRAALQEGDTVVIWGAGKVGQAILQAVKTKTSNAVIIVDILEKRLQQAKESYPDIHILNALREDPVSAVMDLTGSKGVDIAFEAIGHYVHVDGRENPVRNCIQSIRGAGTVCVLGLGKDPVPLLMKELIWKEARLVASRVSQGEFAEAIENLEQGRLKPQAMISDVIKAEDIQKGFEMLEQAPDDHLKIMLQFD